MTKVNLLQLMGWEEGDFDISTEKMAINVEVKEIIGQSVVLDVTGTDIFGTQIKDQVVLQAGCSFTIEQPLDIEVYTA